MEAVRLVTKLLTCVDGRWGPCFNLPNLLLTHPLEMALLIWGGESQTGAFLPQRKKIQAMNQETGGGLARIGTFPMGNK